MRKCPRDRTPQIDCKSNEVIPDQILDKQRLLSTFTGSFSAKNVSGEKVEEVGENFSSPLLLLLLSGLEVSITSFP